MKNLSGYFGDNATQSDNSATWNEDKEW